MTLPVVIPALERNLGEVSPKSPVLHVPSSRSHIPKLRNVLGMAFTAFQSPFPAASGAEPGISTLRKNSQEPQIPPKTSNPSHPSPKSQNLQHSQPGHSREQPGKGLREQIFIPSSLIIELIKARVGEQVCTGLGEGDLDPLEPGSFPGNVTTQTAGSFCCAPMKQNGIVWIKSHFPDGVT